VLEQFVKKSIISVHNFHTPVLRWITEMDDSIHKYCVVSLFWTFYLLFARIGQHVHAFLVIIIMPHCSTAYVYAAYCYRPSSMVCMSVGLSVCLSVTLMSPAKLAEPIEMPFGLRTRVGPGNHV